MAINFELQDLLQDLAIGKPRDFGHAHRIIENCAEYVVSKFILG
jgi:hypothetical protein